MRIALVAGQQRLTGVVTKGNFLDDGNLEKHVILYSCIFNTDQTVHARSLYLTCG